MKTVNEVISAWTNEECERHKGLIEECKKREELIKSTGIIAKRKLSELEINLKDHIGALNNLYLQNKKTMDFLEDFYLKIIKTEGTI
jgi:L-2-hydroxyglutarate oxidase LhgO